MTGNHYARGDEPIRITLPFPPSVNGYWRHVMLPTKGGKQRPATLISREGREFAKNVKALCLGQRLANLRLEGDLAVCVALFPPDRRARDVDNYSKALLDALTKAEVWLDDSQLSRLLVERRDPDTAYPRAEVTIQVRQAQGRLA
jgi:crossover junction endodeoxyribonuclease RusA